MLTGFQMILMCIILTYSSNSNAINNILDQIEIDQVHNDFIITVSYIKPLLFRSHSPNNSGDLISIHLAFQNKLDASILESEALVWKPTDLVPLFEVSLEPSNSIGADLIFRFSKTVHFEILNSTDLYSTKIKLHPSTPELKN